MKIVELEKGVYLAPWQGDPGRTLVLGSAKVFANNASAKKALENARGLLRKFPNAVIRPTTRSR